MQNQNIFLLYSFIGQSQTKQLLKKLDNLGQREFSAKNAILKITAYDCLLVNHPEIYSEGGVGAVKR